MRRMCRKRGGDPVEELELQTGTARVEAVTMDQQKGEDKQGGSQDAEEGNRQAGTPRTHPENHIQETEMEIMIAELEELVQEIEKEVAIEHDDLDF